jgi:predicted RecB family nuclease
MTKKRIRYEAKTYNAMKESLEMIIANRDGRISSLEEQKQEWQSRFFCEKKKADALDRTAFVAEKRKEQAEFNLHECEKTLKIWKVFAAVVCVINLSMAFVIYLIEK